MKKIVSTISAGVMMFCFGGCTPSILRSAALASGTPTAISSSATSGPTAPVTISAPTPPIMVTSAATMAGATAPPRKPAKVWIEKARPMRASSMWADRIA